LCHNCFTSLMIVFCCQNYTICLIDQAQRGFLFFLAVNQGYEERYFNTIKYILHIFVYNRAFLFTVRIILRFNFTKKYVIQLMGGPVSSFSGDNFGFGRLSLDYKFLLGSAIFEMASLRRSLTTPLVFSRFHDPPRLFYLSRHR